MAQRFDALLFRAGVVEQRRLLKFDFAKCRSLRLNGAISGTVWLSGRQFCGQAVPSQDEQSWRRLLNPGPASAEWYGSSQAEDETEAVAVVCCHLLHLCSVDGGGCGTALRIGTDFRRRWRRGAGKKLSYFVQIGVEWQRNFNSVFVGVNVYDKLQLDLCYFFFFSVVHKAVFKRQSFFPWCSVNCRYKGLHWCEKESVIIILFYFFLLFE